MSAVAAGPLPALIAYYERLRTDPTQGVAEYGFSPQGVSFCVVLEENGSLFSRQLSDLRGRAHRAKQGSLTQSRPRQMMLPFRGNRSGQRPPPNFLWDNTGYVLGMDDRTKPDLLRWKREEFVRLHHAFRTKIDDVGYSAVCRFLEAWDPNEANGLPGWEEICGTNLVFKIRGQSAYVHQSKVVQDAWIASLSGEEETILGESLVTGRIESLARLHMPAIKGVEDPGGQAEKRLVSFNKDAYESYGKAQSFNSPVGDRDAFRYTTALNRLLADDSRKVRVGDATVVFWTDSAEATEVEDIARHFFAEAAPPTDAAGKSAEDSLTLERLRAFLNSARQGRLSDTLVDPRAPFYVLGLSPNASRLNVRFWMPGTVGQFRDRLSRHIRDIEMTGAREGDPPLMIRRLLMETAREPKDIPPQLAGEVARAVLGGLPYPRSLFAAVLRRIRADATVNHRRAAILKAFLVRNQHQEVPVALDKDHPDAAYHLGRLFAVLEKTQEDAGLSSTIKDGYFAAASATPGIVFPRLLRLHQHHMRKLDHPGMRVVREKLVAEIVGHFRGFPSRLAMEDQGLFHVAYYHQRQDLFAKKADRTGNEDTNTEAVHEQG